MADVAKTVKNVKKAAKVIRIVLAVGSTLSAIGIPLLVLVVGLLLFVMISQGGGYNTAITATPAGCPTAAPTTGTALPTLTTPPSTTAAPALPVTAPIAAAPPRPGGTYAGVTLSSAQVTAAAGVAAAARQLSLNPRALRIALAVAMQESTFNPQAVNGIWVGLFQQSPDLYTAHPRTDPAGAADMFFRQLVSRVPGYAADPRADWELGEAVQESGVGRNVAKWQPMAAALAQALTTDQAAPGAGAGQPALADVPAVLSCPTSGGGANATFDPGNIVSDAVFYNASSMTVGQIWEFIAAQNAGCDAVNPWCLRTMKVSYPAQPADPYCAAIPAGQDVDAATAISTFATACKINPQVMLVTLQKESQGLTRTSPTATSYDAAWGWNCPDTGPGGTANCAPEGKGFFMQGYRMAKQWSRYRERIPTGAYPYQVGKTVDILYNVVETGCGGAPVTIANLATASLYVYTPYQPNAASVAAYPGEGDRCSSYGNRNFFFMFQKYFGDTGGGKPPAGAPSGGAGPVTVTGVAVTLPRSADIPPELWGQQITAPTPAVAKGIAAGFQNIGLPYVWGGGTNNGPADQGCARGGGSLNSCQGTVGFDCSGLTGFVLGQAGFTTPTNSSSQRAAGVSVPRTQALAGDIIGYPGHVALYLGTVNGQGPYLLEAPEVGKNVRVRPVNWNRNADTNLHRYWTVTSP